MFVLRGSAQQFFVQALLSEVPHRFSFLHGTGPALIEVLRPAFSLASDAFLFVVMMLFSRALRGAQEEARLAERGRHGPGRACGHEPSEEMKNEDSAEASCQRKARLWPGKSLNTETRECRHGCGMATDQQQHQKPRRKQTEEKR